MRSEAKHLPRSGRCAIERSEPTGFDVAGEAASEAGGADGGQAVTRIAKGKVGAGGTAIAVVTKPWCAARRRGAGCEAGAACKPQAGERSFAGQRSGAAAAGQEVRRSRGR